MKFVSLFLFFIYTCFAYVQLNDFDPWLWVSVYGYLAIVAAMGVFGKFHKVLITIGMLGTLIGSLWLMPSVYEWLVHHEPADLLYGMSPDKPYIEESRESLGLLICFLGMFILFRKASVQHPEAI
ncbi:transmembrane 220 family protein [Rapidithrix thailandica]|uniref:Transmembrane 220 family protein n=1 Tax=Rapidithrix thailandica TaxID=413964 RepID=A0AAW9SDM7_9BACT